MEWVKQLITKHTAEDGTFNADAFTTEFNTEFPKNAVPKSEFNARGDELKAARQAIKDAEAANGDVEKIKQAAAEAEAARVKAEGDLAAHVKGSKVRDALRDAGGKDLDYLAYKLGDVDEADLPNKVKDLAGSLPDFFAKTEQPEETKPTTGGYQVIDNGLKGAKTDDAKSLAAAFDAALKGSF